MLQLVLEFFIWGAVLDAIQAVGWALLKIVTLGRYRHDPSDSVIEGSVGFAALAAVTWMTYRLVA